MRRFQWLEPPHRFTVSTTETVYSRSRHGKLPEKPLRSHENDMYERLLPCWKYFQKIRVFCKSHFCQNGQSPIDFLQMRVLPWGQWSEQFSLLYKGDDLQPGLHPRVTSSWRNPHLFVLNMQFASRQSHKHQHFISLFSYHVIIFISPQKVAEEGKPPLFQQNLGWWKVIHPGRSTWNLQITQFRKENDLPFTSTIDSPIGPSSGGVTWPEFIHWIQGIVTPCLSQDVWLHGPFFPRQWK